MLATDLMIASYNFSAMAETPFVTPLLLALICITSFILHDCKDTWPSWTLVGGGLMIGIATLIRPTSLYLGIADRVNGARTHALAAAVGSSRSGDRDSHRVQLAAHSALDRPQLRCVRRSKNDHGRHQQSGLFCRCRRIPAQTRRDSRGKPKSRLPVNSRSPRTMLHRTPGSATSRPPKSSVRLSSAAPKVLIDIRCTYSARASWEQQRPRFRIRSISLPR